MKLFVKLMALVLVLALAGPFFLKGPDGKPLMEIDSVLAGIRNQWNRLVADTGRSVGIEDAGKVEVHRWQDEDGNWHFSDEANPQGESEVIEVDPYASRMDPFVPRPTDDDKAEAADESSGIGVPLPLSVSPGEARQLLEDTAKVKEDLENRTQELDEKLRQ